MTNKQRLAGKRPFHVCYSVYTISVSPSSPEISWEKKNTANPKSSLKRRERDTQREEWVEEANKVKSPVVHIEYTTKVKSEWRRRRRKNNREGRSKK
jgi:hypothetical protein